MWLLRNEDKGLVFRIHPGKQNVVSRKDGDLLLLGDQSISRKHAELTVRNENKNEGIILNDLGSKYGTFTVLGGGELTQASPNQPITLNNGDAIRFGIQWNTWRVEYFPLVVATSTLIAGEKTEVKDVVAVLGGEVVSDWQPCCTHLTMNKLTVTVKVVCALACGKPIVLPGYWRALQEALASTQGKLPDCKDFVPPLAETLLNPSEVSFTPNPERSKLFSGYTFVAASARQLTRIKPMITAAGGKAVEFSASSWPESKLMHDKTILMLHSAADRQGSQQSQVPDGYVAAARKLKAVGVRCVPESDIGLCVLYCSMAQYCNPRFSPKSLFGASTSQSTQQITIICPNTQESIKLQSNGVKSTNSKKRALEDSPSEEEKHPSKKTNSEDMFSPPSVVNKTDIAPLKNTGSKEKQPIVDPSLDMFAPSGHISGQSDQNKNTLSRAKTNPDNFGNIPKERPPVINPSLDMFAPSGQTSNKENKNEIPGPSCQDMFASNESRQTLENKRSNCNESSSLPKKQPRMVQVDEENDDFDLTTNKKSSKSQKIVVEKDDEFSFTSARKSNKSHLIDQGDGDEFSFASNKKKSRQNMAEDHDDAFSFSSTRKSSRSNLINQDDGDEFSFPSTKNGNPKSMAEDQDDFSFVSRTSSKKRNRQSNPDMFESSAERLKSNNKACASNKTNKSNITSHEDNEENEDLFTFAGGPATKRRKDDGTSLNLDEPDAEVKIALFSKKDNASLGPKNTSEPTIFDGPPDEKNLITYSKNISCPPKIKEEVGDEEVDELAKELQNATIVIVKPLVVTRQRTTEAHPISSGKNFKTFRKAMGINKRIVPHIIGGSDLVPHYANCQNIDDVLPPSPPPLSPEDDWGFPKEKKKGKTR